VIVGNDKETPDDIRSFGERTWGIVRRFVKSSLCITFGYEKYTTIRGHINSGKIILSRAITRFLMFNIQNSRGTKTDPHP